MAWKHRAVTNRTHNCLDVFIREWKFWAEEYCWSETIEEMHPTIVTILNDNIIAHTLLNFSTWRSLLSTNPPKLISPIWRLSNKSKRDGKQWFNAASSLCFFAKKMMASTIILIVIAAVNPVHSNKLSLYSKWKASVTPTSFHNTKNTAIVSEATIIL